MHLSNEIVNLIANALILKNSSQINISDNICIEELGQENISRIYDEIYLIAQNQFNKYNLDLDSTDYEIIKKIVDSEKLRKNFTSHHL